MIVSVAMKRQSKITEKVLMNRELLNWEKSMRFAKFPLSDSISANRAAFLAWGISGELMEVEL